jgi:hypothetical protein
MISVRIALVALLVFTLTAVGDETGKARIITSSSKAAQCISPIHVKKIDGKNVNVNRQMFELAPGRHSLWGSALIDTSFCKAVGIGSGRNNPDPIEADFEAGKTYYVGYDHKASNRRDWKFVIWKVEED